MENLEYLRLSSNQLSGDISRWLNDSTRITSIDIYGNNFTGSIPDSIFRSDLNTLSIANNHIEGLPDFSGIEMPMAYVGVERNKLSFDDLRKLDNVSTFNEDRMTIGPQRQLLTPDTIIALPGDELSISSGSADDSDMYQWYRNGEVLTGETGRDIKIASFTDTDEGVYTCIINNPDFEFELERSPVLIQADAVSSTHIIRDANVKIGPNPTPGQISVTGVSLKEISVLDAHGHVLMSTRSSVIDLSPLMAGSYLLRIIGESGEVITKRVVKV